MPHTLLLGLQVFPDEAGKAAWLSAQLEGFIDAGDVLVFAGQRARVDELVGRLQQAGVKAAGIHGDMDQVGR
jgi:ATP-dependent RNA helicase DDX42